MLSIGLIGVLAPNVAVRRSKGRRSVLFIFEAAEDACIFFCTLNSDRLSLPLLSFHCEVDTFCLSSVVCLLLSLRCAKS